jgi:hypothetical protein
MDDQTLHHFMEDLLPIVVFPILTIAFAWVISQIIGTFRHRAHLRAQTDCHNRMMEKFSSAEEFTIFLQSEAGRNFFDSLTSEPAAPLGKILNSIKTGTILTLLGGGFFILGVTSKTEDAANALFILGTVTFTVGIGFLISSAISYRLAKNWGIISVDKKQVSNQPSANAV